MGSPPTPPPMYDPNAIAGSQNQFNKQAFQQQLSSAGHTGQDTPIGTSQYYQTGTDSAGNPIYTNKTQFTPEEQALFEKQQATQKTAGEQANALLGGANYGVTPDFMNMSTGLTADMLNKQVGLLSPYFKQQTDALDNKLRNQGIVPNKSGSASPAYDFAMKQNQDNQNNAVISYLLQAQPQAFSEAIQNWQAPANMAGALAGLGAPGNLTASFNPLTNAPTAQPPNVAAAYGAANTSNMNNATVAGNQYSGLMNGIFGTAGTLGSAAIKNPAGVAALGGMFL